MSKTFKTGDYVQLTHYCKVIGSRSDSTHLRDVKTGFEFYAQGGTQDKIISSTQHEESKKITRTAMKDMVLESNGTVFSVKYIKKNGEERTLYGHLLYNDGFGRAHCWDLEKNSERQVDLRTVFELTINEVCYTLK